MASTGVNVLRWSALGLGVLYGFSKQSSITAADNLKAAQKEYSRKESLIQQAKQEWQRKQNPQSDSVTASAKKALDGSEKDFDLEVLLNLKD